MANGSKNDCFLGINLISEHGDETKERTRWRKEIKYFSMRNDDGRGQRSKRKQQKKEGKKKV
jgi:hypothetical protein